MTTTIIAGRFRLLAQLAIAAIVALVLAACSGAGETANVASETRAILHTAKGSFAFNIEVVDTEESRAKGLMFRNELAADAGMLFDYHEEQQAAFWMQNTLIPLDMIFIGANGVVKKVHVNARPLDTTSIPSGVPVRFVLEIPGGRSNEIGLAAGDRLEHPRVAN